MTNDLQKTLISNSKSNLKEEEQKLISKNKEIKKKLDLRKKILDSRLKRGRKVSRLRYYLTSLNHN